jgi:Domain of unknown function (DUF5753)/Helix-turn-helix domain
MSAEHDIRPEAGPHRPGSAVVRIMLGAELRRLREAAEISPEAAAWRIRAHRSKISRLENGRIGFKPRDVSDLLDLYGVTDPEVIAGMLELAGLANAQTWWGKYGDVLPAWLEPYLGLEASARLIRTFDLQFVHGLLQTENYARAVTTRALPPADPVEISRRVSVRLRRQELLDGANAPRVWSILDEAALRRPVGGPAVMREQLEHLIEIARLPHVTLQVIPFRAGAHDAAGGAFTLLRFAEPDIPDVVYLEQLAGAQYLEKPAEVDLYREALDRLTATALSPAQTTDFLAELAGDM